MRIELDDLFCPTCRSYVHLFLEQCPACGTPRASRYEDALASAPGERSDLASSSAVGSAATHALRRHALTLSRGGLMGMGSTDAGAGAEGGLDVSDLFNRIARPLSYRAYGATSDPKAPIDCSLLIDEGRLQVRDPRRSETAASIPAAQILAVTPAASAPHGAGAWPGIAFRGFAAPVKRIVVAGDLLVANASSGTFRLLSVGNRPGFFGSKARPDFYLDLVRWLGLASALASEARWLEIGASAYAAELGIGPSAPRKPKEPAAAGQESPGSGGQEARSAAAGVQEALEELERLRAAALVTESEYQRKRSEILGRL